MEHFVITRERPADTIAHQRALRSLAAYLLDEEQNVLRIPRRKVVTLEGFSVSLVSVARLPEGALRSVLRVMGAPEQQLSFDVQSLDGPVSEQEGLAQALGRLAIVLRERLGLGSPNVGRAEIPVDQDFLDASGAQRN